MAKARTAKQRAALKKAQLASARKRKGHGKSRGRVGYRRVSPAHVMVRANNSRRKRRRNLAIAGGLVAAGVAGYAARHHIREGALKKKHGAHYLPRKVTLYHHTYRGSHAKILKQQSFIHKGRFHDKQDRSKVWFTTGHKEGSHMDLYGNHVVKVRVSRRHIAKSDFNPGWGSGGAAGRGLRKHKVGWVGLDRSALKGKRIRSHLNPRGRAQDRARAKRVTALRRKRR